MLSTVLSDALRKWSTMAWRLSQDAQSSSAAVTAKSAFSYTLSL